MTRSGALIRGKRGRMLPMLALIPAAALAARVGGRGGGDALARGQQLYLDDCASCHGGKLAMQPTSPMLVKGRWNQSGFTVLIASS